jgi:hypothetical protein
MNRPKKRVKRVRRSKKSAKRVQRVQRLGIIVDTRDWELGDWPDRIMETVEIDKSVAGIAITFDMGGEPFAKLAQKIASEAIEAFFDSVYVHATSEGLTFSDDSDHTKQEHSLPFGSIWIRDLRTFDAIREWMREELKGFGGTDEKSQKVIIDECRKQGIDPPTFSAHGEPEWREEI